MKNRFDPDKDMANQAKHGISLALGDRIFGDTNHVIIPSIRDVDGEERFKIVGLVHDRMFTGVFVWRATSLASCP